MLRRLRYWRDALMAVECWRSGNRDTHREVLHKCAAHRRRNRAQVARVLSVHVGKVIDTPRLASFLAPAAFSGPRVSGRLVRIHR